jgi:hypothetical protein
MLGLMAPQANLLKHGSGAICRVTNELLLDPAKYQAALDFTVSMFPGSPAVSWSGLTGLFVGATTNPAEIFR